MKTLRSARATFSGSACTPALLAAMLLTACYDLDFDFFDGSSSGSSGFQAPAQLGGLPPSEGSDLLDASFAQAGMLDSDAFHGTSSTRVVVDAQSRPLVVGYGALPPGLLVLRLTLEGANDPTFGTSGAFLFPDDATGRTRVLREAPACLIDASERILLLWSFEDFDVGTRALVLRLEPDGELDPTFGDMGRVFIQPRPGAFHTFGVGLALDAAGRILVCADEAGFEGRRVVVARLDESGALDGKYGDAGIARGPEGEESLGARVLSDSAGGALVAGTLPEIPGRIALWRFDGNGLLDPGFGPGGIVTQEDSSQGANLAAVDAAADASGRIYLLANRADRLSQIDAWPSHSINFQATPTPVYDVIVWRFLAEGALDQSFAAAGARNLAFNSGPYVPSSLGFVGGDRFDAATGLFVDETGRIVIAGWSDEPTWDTSVGFASFYSPTSPFLARLTESGDLDPSFHGVGHALLGSDSSVVTIVPFPHGRPTSLASDPSGRWLLTGSADGGALQRVWRIVP